MGTQVKGTSAIGVVGRERALAHLAAIGLEIHGGVPKEAVAQADRVTELVRHHVLEVVEEGMCAIGRELREAVLPGIEHDVSIEDRVGIRVDRQERHRDGLLLPRPIGFRE